MQPKYWAITLLATAAISASAIYYEKQPALDTGPVVIHHEVKSQQTATSPASVATSSTENIAGWQTYTNNAEGFQLTFPDAWKGYRTSDGLTFEVPTTATWTPDPGWFMAFEIWMYSESDWQQTENQDGPKPILMGDNGTTVFAWRGSADTPDDLQGKINPEDVAKTFKFIKPQSSTTDWQTYSNSQYGFRIQYPTSWTGCNPDSTILASSEKNVWEIRRDSSCDLTNKSDVVRVQELSGVYTVYPNYDSLKAAIEDRLKPLNSKGDFYGWLDTTDLANFNNIEETAVSGLSALRITAADDGASVNQETNDLVYYNDNLFNISFFSADGSGMTKEEQEILSTFKFKN